ncbi:MULTISPECIES: hypothetical protein [Pyrobaculum]|uniref:Uncharacterized protein n=1 Tax=Pyrobaculum arsenaticum TaxID=121277 RepID=A0A7L4P6R9_9CREN|nr:MULTISPECIES: hypothetical protein [Pyrobaculum]MCX8137389.1 hypothetical protein [Pyrobaculum aerophilum]MCY0890304.1 hypothetical protein [Pyrobaculum arsenaticum]NYR14738.1 hypothetical protein [Pyrobaculum arsenaticum]
MGERRSDATICDGKRTVEYLREIKRYVMRGWLRVLEGRRREGKRLGRGLEIKPSAQWKSNTACFYRKAHHAIGGLRITLCEMAIVVRRGQASCWVDGGFWGAV